MASSRRKIIVSCAVTGGIHVPSLSPYLPIGIKGISDSAVEAAEAGASIVHIHNRTEEGQPTPDLDSLGEILSRIKSKSKVVIGISTGGAKGQSLEERLASIPRFRPEMASFNSGSVNVNLSGLIGKIEGEPRFDWEIPFLESTYDYVFKNTFKDMEYGLKLMNECGTRPEFEVFDLGMLNNILQFTKKGLVSKPNFVFVSGVVGGIPQNPDNMMFFVQSLERMFGKDIPFSMVAGGRKMFRNELLSVLIGGNVRVGMEDGLYMDVNGELATSNAKQIEKMIRLLHALDYEVATPDEAREILGLKGHDQVNF